MRFWAICLSMFLVPSAAMAQSRLDPEKTIFGGDEFLPGYKAMVASILRDAFDSDVSVRMVGLPSFTPEYAVGIRSRGGHFEIFALEASEQIWGYDGRHAPAGGTVAVGKDGKLDTSGAKLELPPGVASLPVKKCILGISDQTAHAIIDDWRKMLLQVRYGSDPRLGLDGETFHFGYREESRFMAGQIWTPERGSNDAVLVQLALTMRDMCMSHDAASLNKLSEQASELGHRLN